MKKIVINTCFGGFSLSPEALLWPWDRGMKEIGSPVREYYGGTEKFAKTHPRYAGEWESRFRADLSKWREHIASRGAGKPPIFMNAFSPEEKFVLSGGREIDRDNPLLIECVETLGEKSYGVCAELSIVEIPDDVEWEIDEYDGNEHIAEKHRTWR